MNPEFENRVIMWKHVDDKITRTFKFKTFKNAMKFVERIAMYATKSRHHPEIYNLYNVVTITLTTHDVGNQITEKDILFAEYLDILYKQNLNYMRT